MVTIVKCSNPREAYYMACEQTLAPFSPYEEGFVTHTTEGVCEVIVTERNQPENRLVFTSPAA